MAQGGSSTALCPGEILGRPLALGRFVTMWRAGNNFEVTAYTQTTVGAFWHRTPASPSLMSGSLQLLGSLQPPHRAGAAGDPASY
jgi:hypothetical protein